ncbi:hypothetical protein [Streptomyces sp. NPDC059009]|uniref:hypothetical protein n=1 Tax=Streptomyces sp. NPDC059009 TaxID=3346694 RepID=UPI003674FE44
MRLKLFSAATGLAALLVAGLAAPASSADVAAGRNVTQKTSDASPGGYMSVRVTYSPDSHGGYKGTVKGHIEDLEGDGYCVVAQVWNDGEVWDISDSPACPKGTAKTVTTAFTKTNTVLVRVCLLKRGYLYYCHQWG